MMIVKTSMVSGVEHTREIDVTPEQIAAWQAGQLIQVAMPDLSPDDREFLMTGTTPEEWSELFPDETDTRTADKIDGYDRDDLGESSDH